jgi:V/A-type H+-transporting ATPase subunit K
MNPETAVLAVNWQPVLLAFAAALALGVSAIATAWVQSKIGAAGAGTLAEKPELTATIVILVAIPETIVILGFVIAAMILLEV